MIFYDSVSSGASLSARKRKLRLPFFALEGMRAPEWGFVIDEVACQSKNPSLSAKGKKQTETQIYLKVCLLFLFARMPAAAQGMDKVNPSLSAYSEWNQLKISWFLFYFSRYSPRLLPLLLSYNFFRCTFVLVL